MIKLPNNYGRICIIAMVTCYITILVIQAGILIKSGDKLLVQAVGSFGMVVITSVFALLAVPCVINFHTKEKV